MLRKSNEGDCRKIYELICDMEQTALPYDIFENIYLEQLADPARYCLIYEDEEGVKGELNLRFENQLHHCGRVAEIMEFAVDSSFRSRGIGKLMFARAVEISKEFSCIQIEVASNQLRKDAHRFYFREGMHNFHYKLSKSFSEEASDINVLGR